MDVDPQSAPDVDRTYQDLTDSAKQLSNSVDTSIDFQLRGGPGNISCSGGGCTVTATTTTSVSATGGAKVTGGTVTAQLTATMSINGLPAGSCSRKAPLPLNGTGAISCSNPAAGAVFVQADAAAKARARATARPGTIYRWTVTSRANIQIVALAQVNVEKLVKDLENKRADAATGPPNSAGSAYPRALDPRSGRPIPHPGAGLSKVPVGDRVPWGAQQRGEYIKEWYDRGYSTPPGAWNLYDIHHIVPREYGGTNAFTNLVPVLRSVHQGQFNPWWRNY